MWKEREDYSWIHWFKEAPVQLIDRSESAAKSISGYEFQRNSEKEIIVYRGGGQGLDVLTIAATQDADGTRLEISGRSEPDVIHALRQALVDVH